MIFGFAGGSGLVPRIFRGAWWWPEAGGIGGSSAESARYLSVVWICVLLSFRGAAGSFGADASGGWSRSESLSSSLLSSSNSGSSSSELLEFTKDLLTTLSFPGFHGGYCCTAGQVTGRHSVVFLETGVCCEHDWVWPVLKLSDSCTGDCGEEKGGTIVELSSSAVSVDHSAHCASSASSAGDSDDVHALSSRSGDSACLPVGGEAVGIEVVGDSTLSASGKW